MTNVFLTAFGLTKFVVRMTQVFLTAFGLTKFVVRMTMFFLTAFGLTKFVVRMTMVFLRLKPFRLRMTTFGLRTDAVSFESDN